MLCVSISLYDLFLENNPLMGAVGKLPTYLEESKPDVRSVYRQVLKLVTVQMRTDLAFVIHPIISVLAKCPINGHHLQVLNQQ